MAFSWDPQASRYRGPGGRFLSRTQVVGALNDTLDRTRKKLNEVARQLQAGQISLTSWQRQTRGLVKSIHLYSAAAARGGWDQLGPADFGRLGARIKAQYRYLDRFARQLASGDVDYLGDGFLNRVDLYGQAGRATFMLEERADRKAKGYTEERSILNAADHCLDCLSEAAAGWSPIGSLIPIGSRQCRANCRCDFDYR